MSRFLPVWAATLCTLLLLDGVWLGLIAMPMYRQGIGHLMADHANIAAAVAFYLMYAAGVTAFAVRLDDTASRIAPAAGRGALLGIVAYATYDLTNLATLRDWPPGLSGIDVAWGACATALAAAVGRWVALRRPR